MAPGPGSLDTRRDGKAVEAAVPGYAVPTAKAARAEAESRRRRVQSALASRTGAAARRAAWVDAQFPVADFEAAADLPGKTKQLSPGAAENKRVAARLPAGFPEMVVEDLREERQILERRLSALAAACSAARPPPGTSWQTSRGQASGGTGASSSTSGSSAAGAGGGKVIGALAMTTAGFAAAPDGGEAGGLHGPSSPGAQSFAFSTPRRPPTPPTVARPLPSEAGPSQQSPTAAATSARPSSTQTAAAAPATPASPARTAAAEPSKTSTPVMPERQTSGRRQWVTAAPPAGVAVTGGARRQLLFGDGMAGPAQQGPPVPAAGADAAATAVGGISLLDLRRQLHRPTAAATPVVAEALAVASQAAAAGSSVAAGAAVAALDALLGVAPPAPPPGPYLQRLHGPSWLDPVDLLRPHGSLIKFKQGRAGNGPLTADLHVQLRAQYEYEGSHLCHRERLRAGIADLNAELHSSWRAMVASGARRLAQQRRKWEESQQQQQQQQQPSAPGASAPTASAPPAAAAARPRPLSRIPPAAPGADAAAPAAAPKTAATKSRAPQQPQRQQQTHSAASSTKPAAAAAPRSRDGGSGASTSASGSAAKREGDGRKPPPAAARARGIAAAAPGGGQARPAAAAAAASRAGAPPPVAAAAASTQWPSLFTGCRGGAPQPPGSRLLPAPLTDLTALSGDALVELAKHWTQELVDWQKAQGGRGAGAAAEAGASAVAAAGAGVEPGQEGPGAQGGRRVGVSLPQLQSEGLPQLAAARLELLTAAVDKLVKAAAPAAAAAPSSQPQQPAPLIQQQLADLVWVVAHYDWGHCEAALAPAMAVPFAVVPQFMPGLRLEDFMAEVALNRDVIYLEDGSKAVEESRLTGWQSDIAATFKYSGKEMIPDPSGMTPAVRKVRDELQRLTGVWYDSVLINYYGDGKCGMRYHVDPLYGVWSPESAVVSVGDTRTFIFREIADYDSRWQYRVRNGDVVRMWGDCQDRLQHCVRVERAAADAGPRMSLVFKERLRGPGGEYLQGPNPDLTPLAGNATRALLHNLTIALPTCDVLWELTALECTFRASARWPTPGLQAGAGFLFYRSLQGLRSAAAAVNITCPPDQWAALLAASVNANSNSSNSNGNSITSGTAVWSSAYGGSRTPLAPCATATIKSGDELLAALAALQQSAARVLLTLAANVSLPPTGGPTPMRLAVAPEDEQPLARVYRNVTLVGGGSAAVYGGRLLTAEYLAALAAAEAAAAAVEAVATGSGSSGGSSLSSLLGGGTLGGTEFNIRQRRNGAYLAGRAAQASAGEVPGGAEGLRPVLTLAHVHIVNLPPGPPSSWPMGLMSTFHWWLGGTDKTGPASPQLNALRCATTGTSTELSYQLGWYKLLVATSRADRDEAAWMASWANPLQQVMSPEDGTVTTYNQAGAFRAYYNTSVQAKVLLTTPGVNEFDMWTDLPAVPPSPAAPPAANATAAPAAAAAALLPPTAFAFANSTAELLALLQEPWVGTGSSAPYGRFIFLTNNISLNAGNWPPGGAALSYNVTLFGPTRGYPPVRLDTGTLPLVSVSVAAATPAVLLVRFLRLRLAGDAVRALTAVPRAAVAAAPADAAAVLAATLSLRDWRDRCLGASSSNGDSSSVAAGSAWQAEAYSSVFELPAASLVALLALAMPANATPPGASQQPLLLPTGPVSALVALSAVLQPGGSYKLYDNGSSVGIQMRNGSLGGGVAIGSGGGGRWVAAYGASSLLLGEASNSSASSAADAACDAGSLLLILASLSDSQRGVQQQQQQDASQPPPPPPQSTADGGGNSGGGSNNVGAIVGGVVGGVVAVAAVALFIWLWARRRNHPQQQQQQAEGGDVEKLPEGVEKQQQVDAAGGGKAPMSDSNDASGGAAMSTANLAAAAVGTVGSEEAGATPTTPRRASAEDDSATRAMRATAPSSGTIIAAASPASAVPAADAAAATASTVTAVTPDEAAQQGGTSVADSDVQPRQTALLHHQPQCEDAAARHHHLQNQPQLQLLQPYGAEANTARGAAGLEVDDDGPVITGLTFSTFSGPPQMDLIPSLGVDRASPAAAAAEGSPAAAAAHRNQHRTMANVLLGSRFGVVPAAAAGAADTAAASETTTRTAADLAQMIQEYTAAATAGAATANNIAGGMSSGSSGRPAGSAPPPRVLGRGAYGVVVLGEWRGLPAAIKVMMFTAGDAKHAHRLAREVALTTSLSHAHVVPTYHYTLETLPADGGAGSVLEGPATAGGRRAGAAAMAETLAAANDPLAAVRLRLVMQYCEGGNLGAALKSGSFDQPLLPGRGSPAEGASASPTPALATAAAAAGSQQRDRPTVQNLPLALLTALDVLSGLAYLHSCNVVHGDLSENNILLKAVHAELSPAALRSAAAAAAAACEGAAATAASSSSAAAAGTTQQQQGPAPPNGATTASATGSDLSVTVLPAMGAQQPPAARSSGVGGGSGSASGSEAPRLFGSTTSISTFDSSMRRVYAEASGSLVSAGGGDSCSGGPASAAESTTSRRLEASMGRAVRRLLGVKFKISDFGLSVQMTGDGQTHISNMRQGTPFFAAPELVATGRLAPAADMYSFGVVLWLLLHGVALGQMAHLLPRSALIPVHAALLRHTSPALPPAAAELLADCLSPRPEHRPAAAAARERVAALLQEVVGLEMAELLTSGSERHEHGGAAAALLRAGASAASGGTSSGADTANTTNTASSG
ncbi:hypothetical protein HXX76_004147 [Chlamydomonas incerta]|uniref:Fe2OG dioxygenase domain-containing protein n=1 Tax=Chlamydomonas incerta TaxID=51695 RepID=A0A835TLQ1_CHLIN|nr:hypothetical protein HXX76_004147 [Chlamydomonas incerta]|eukprot:KAG2440030.1 hypothetical protein HXX76_004147 [Chlamydomonas incerta]